ncbi:MAG: PASTA domain-containing protein [Nannocystis sp.]|nr:PASTA domain-containing protein [Nannocystis sp.]
MNDTLKTVLISLIVAVLVQIFLGPQIMKMTGTLPAAPQQVLVQPAPQPLPAPQVIVEQPAPAPAPSPTAPDYRGITVKKARSLAGAQGIVIIEDEQRDAPDKRPGEILEQDPPPGTVLTTREIRVVVAKAKEDLKIPTVTGKTLDEARVELEALGFEVPEPIAQDSNRTPGTVLAQEPKGGAKAPSGTDVKLTIASMPMLEVPKMTGKYLRTAKADLQNIGLELGEVRRTEHAEHGEGYVLRQEPAAGTKVPFGTAIKLTVVAPN